MKFEELYKGNLAETKKKIKKSVKFDNFIVQAINNISDINKVGNILVKRLREWYELYNPEFSRSMIDHEKFVELVINGNEDKIKDSMGANLSKIDLEPIVRLAKGVDELNKLKKKQEDYLEKLMKENCPNITAVAGALIGAKLIAVAGSLKKLVEFPASTVQLLGAEKALFRHIKTGAKPPRHGVIIQHPLISEAPQREHGKRARALADKILLAAKIDYFKGEFIGDKLRKKLEDRFK